MSVYSRYKKGPEGFRALVELLESTPASRRKRMIEVGMSEDPEFTQKAVALVLTFADIESLPDAQLAEVMNKAPARILAFALKVSDAETQQRFIRCAPPAVGAEVRDMLVTNPGPREIEGARIKIVTVARELERAGLVRVKQLPKF